MLLTRVGAKWCIYIDGEVNLNSCNQVDASHAPSSQQRQHRPDGLCQRHSCGLPPLLAEQALGVASLQRHVQHAARRGVGAWPLRRVASSIIAPRRSRGSTAATGPPNAGMPPTPLLELATLELLGVLLPLPAAEPPYAAPRRRRLSSVARSRVEYTAASQCSSPAPTAASSAGR